MVFSLHGTLLFNYHHDKDIEKMSELATLVWFLSHPRQSNTFLFTINLYYLQNSPLPYFNSQIFACEPVFCLCQWCACLFLPYLAISVFTFLCTGLLEGRRKERF